MYITLSCLTSSIVSPAKHPQLCLPPWIFESEKVHPPQSMKRKSVSFVACVAKRLLGLGSQAGWHSLSLMLCLMTKSATESEASESASHSIAGNAKMIISRAAKIVTSSFWMTTRSRWQPFVAFPAAWMTTEVGYLCGFSLHSFLMQLSLNEAQQINDAMPPCPFFANNGDDH